jgi:hypothetical protein
MSVRLASIIDDGLDLAEECGWRYAIAYLISEKIPSPIIQRLLFDGGCIRQMTKRRHENSPAWTGSNAHDMKNLFDSLRQRRPVETCNRSVAPRASHPGQSEFD